MHTLRRKIGISIRNAKRGVRKGGNGEHERERKLRMDTIGRCKAKQPQHVTNA
jgi:hypothetical protein